MEKCVNIATIITGITSFCAIVISIVTFVRSMKREQKIDTIKALREIRIKYYNTKSLSPQEKLKYLNQLEFFATGVNEKVYSIDIVKRLSGKRLVRQYDEWAKSFIEERRKKYDNKRTAYCEYENMILELQKYHD